MIGDQAGGPLFFFLMERITTRILKTIEDKNPYRLLDPDGQMSDGVT